jgi:hypothetical protein
MVALLTLLVGVAATVSPPANDDWHVMNSDIVEGSHLTDAHVWKASANVASWEDCQAMCSSNSSCREFAYAFDYTGPDRHAASPSNTAASTEEARERSHYYTEYANLPSQPSQGATSGGGGGVAVAGACSYSKSCFFRNDDWFPSGMHGGNPTPSLPPSCAIM